MAKIGRDPQGLSQETYDLIIVGGGIYGVMLSFEAAKRGLKSLLLEQGDFGGATTFNCLRIIHGGFRYLQTMDLHRFRESVSERRWFLKAFPELVSPLPCLMPLYGNGLRRPLFMRLGGLANDFLSRDRNTGVKAENALPSSQFLDVEEVAQIFPEVDRAGLKGGIRWYDAIIPDPQFVLMEILRRSVQFGCPALNYVEGKSLITANNHVSGITARDTCSDRTFLFRSNVVINAAGPWSRQFASAFDRDYPELFKGSLAWNVLFDKPALSSHALAIAPKQPNARTYFLVPWKGRLLAGTGHAPWNKGSKPPKPTKHMMDSFVDDLNFAVPNVGLTRENILHIFSGLLPATREGGVGLTKREVILDHSEHGGPKGFYSVSGVKFTTARLVAEKLLHRIFPDTSAQHDLHSEVFENSGNGRCMARDFEADRTEGLDTASLEILREIVDAEAVVTLDDLLFRRTDLWEALYCNNDLKMQLRQHLSLSDFPISRRNGGE